MSSSKFFFPQAQFAASGHTSYAKFAYMYFQKMQKLPESHPDVHCSFLMAFMWYIKVIAIGQDTLQTWLLNRFS